jgi:hypothetical protein
VLDLEATGETSAAPRSLKVVGIEDLIVGCGLTARWCAIDRGRCPGPSLRCSYEGRSSRSFVHWLSAAAGRRMGKLHSTRGMRVRAGGGSNAAVDQPDADGVGGQPVE